MHDGHGAQQSGSPAGESRQHGKPARRQHHGPHPIGEHHAVWHVHVAGESFCCGRNGGGLGRAHSHAMHSGYDIAVGAGCSDRYIGRKSNPGQHLHSDVHVGRHDPGR
jgi:hypothetical protein